MSNETNISVSGGVEGDYVNIGGTQNIYFGGHPVEPPPKPDPRKVFLSYARKDDEAFTRRLYEHLTDAGFDAWFDRERMPNRGESFLTEIREAIHAVDTLLLVVGPKALTSDYVRAEWEYALKTCKRVIPLVRLGAYSDVPAPLRKLHAIDCRAERAETDALAEITRNLGEAPAPLGTLYGVPPIPSYYVERDATADVRARLLADADKPVVVTSHKASAVAVNGMGGVGKTTLATALSRTCDVRRTFPDGVFWLEVGQTPDVLALMGSVGAAFGDDRGEYRDRKSATMRLAGLLGDKRVLIVLDDVWEHDHAKDFRVGGTRCRLLVTTRATDMAAKLDASNEALSTMSETEALRLIAERVSTDDTTVAPADLPPECPQIVAMVGGHTLAVSLAAAQLADPDRGGLNHAPRLLARLQKGKYFDKTLALDETDKNLNLELCLRLSYDDLSDDLQRRFRALGVFALEGTFDEGAATAVWGDDDADDTDDALTDLTRAGLLRRAEGNRYQQHGLLRAYARALLVEAKELDAAFGRYADDVIERAAGFRELPPEEWGQLDMLEPHLQAVGDALATRWDARAPESADEDDAGEKLAQRCGDFAANVTRYVSRRRQAVETVDGTSMRGMRWLETGLRVSEHRGDERRQALFCNDIGLAWSGLGEKRKALAFYEQALPLYRAVGDRGGEAVTLSNMGKVWDDLGEKRKALAFYEQALPLNRAVGDRGSEAGTLNNIGAAWSDLGEKRKALAFYEQALPLYRAVGDRGGEATTLSNMGKVWDDLGEKRKALAFYEQALPLRRAVGDRGGEATTLSNIGAAWDGLGEKRKALGYFEQALPLLRAVGDRGGEAATLSNMGKVWDDLGEKRKALAFYEQALVLFRAVGDRGGEAMTLSNMGKVWDDLGEKRKALAFYEQALPLRRAVGDRGGEATTLNNMGMVWDALGEKRKALAYYDEALPLLRAVGDRGVEATTLNNIGLAWSGLGEKRKALAFYDEALPLYRAVGDRGGEAGTLNNIGKVWDDLGEKRKALAFYEEALPLLRAVGDRGVEAATLSNIGAVWSALGEKRKALAFYEQALPLRRAVGDRGGEAVTCYNMGMVYHALGDLDKAIEYVERCVMLEEQIEDPYLESDRRKLAQLKQLKAGADSPASTEDAPSQEEQIARMLGLIKQADDEALKGVAAQLPAAVVAALVSAAEQVNDADALAQLRKIQGMQGDDG